MPAHKHNYSVSSGSLKNTKPVDETVSSRDEVLKLKARYQNEAERLKAKIEGEKSLSRSQSASSLVSFGVNDRFKDFFSDQEDRSHFSTTTSFLKPGATFVGSQQSGRSTYEVIVELKEVDLSKSELSGFLKIQGLTEDYPEIITFFKSEIVGPHYSFYTNHDSWGSSNKNDIQHWSRFSSWRSLNFDIDNDTRNGAIYRDALNQEYIYMRWKETFLVPDAKVTTIRGASFAGFYYICFNQLTGSITGLYFHKSSERFQQLELSHVPDSGRFPVYEYQ